MDIPPRQVELRNGGWSPGGAPMSAAGMKRIEELLIRALSRTEDEIPKGEIEHILRVTKAQIEMVERGLED